MKTMLGTVIIENISSGGSSLGAAAVARARPDGYALWWAARFRISTRPCSRELGKGPQRTSPTETHLAIWPNRAPSELIVLVPTAGEQSEKSIFGTWLAVALDCVARHETSSASSQRDVPRP
jgi:hypothetical protein